MRNVVTHTLDPTIGSPTPQKLVANYRDTTFAEKTDFPILSPRLSPDGTRLALGSKQIWAARRNMNDPPAITSVVRLGFPPVATGILDTVVVYANTVPVGVSTCFQTSATDTEGDALSWYADILGAGMSFTASTRTLCITPAAAGIYYARVRVSEDSGGSDGLIFQLSASSLGPSAARPVGGGEEASSDPDLPPGPNPMTGEFRIAVPAAARGSVRLRIFDVAGRECAAVRGSAGKTLVWRGTDRGGAAVAPGIYAYRLENDQLLRKGRIVLIR